MGMGMGHMIWMKVNAIEVPLWIKGRQHHQRKAGGTAEVEESERLTLRIPSRQMPHEGRQDPSNWGTVHNKTHSCMTLTSDSRDPRRPRPNQLMLSEAPE